MFLLWTNLSGINDSSFLPSIGVGEGVGAGEGDSVSWSSVPRFFPSLDLAMTIWAFSASCSRDFILQEEKPPLDKW